MELISLVNTPVYDEAGSDRCESDVDLDLPAVDLLSRLADSLDVDCYCLAAEATCNILGELEEVEVIRI